MLSDHATAGKIRALFSIVLLRRGEWRVWVLPLYNFEGLELTYLYRIMCRAKELEAAV